MRNRVFCEMQVEPKTGSAKVLRVGVETLKLALGSLDEILVDIGGTNTAINTFGG
jgi:hypothetical protein